MNQIISIPLCLSIIIRILKYNDRHLPFYDLHCFNDVLK
nr:MAG TPA: hypothetical protein [Caudoviricetes sp.]